MDIQMHNFIQGGKKPRWNTFSMKTTTIFFKMFVIMLTCWTIFTFSWFFSLSHSFSGFYLIYPPSINEHILTSRQHRWPCNACILRASILYVVECICVLNVYAFIWTVNIHSIRNDLVRSMVNISHKLFKKQKKRDEAHQYPFPSKLFNK